MNLLSSCNICSFFERLNLPFIGNLILVLSAALGILSMVMWPLMFVWPLTAILGFWLAAGYGSCQECDIST